MSYLNISKVGKLLVSILQKNLYPALINNSDGVALCSPKDRMNASVGIYLYDFRESAYKNNEPINIQSNIRIAPPIYLDLCYMITAYSDSDEKHRAIQEHTILGKIIEILRDNPIIDADAERFVEGDGPNNIKIEMLNIPYTEKEKMLNLLEPTHKPSIFYCVSPVSISSGRVSSVTRVRDLDMEVR